MKKIASCALLISTLTVCLPAGASGGKERVAQVTSRVAGVTVYPRRAQVRRVAELEVPAGSHRLVFPRLPEELRAESVRVSAEGVSGAVLYGFDLRSVLLGSPPRKEVEGLEKRLQDLKDQQRSLNDQRAVHKRHLDTVVETAKRAPEGLAGQLSKGKAQLATWRELLIFMEQRQAAQSKSIQAIDSRLRDVSKALKRVRADLQKLKGFRQQAFQQVEVLVETPRPGKLTVELEYAIEDAGWSPAHDARLDVNGKALEWRTYGVVKQSTGENWTDVAMTLSTARPALRSSPPVLPEWFIHPFTPEVYYPAAPRARAPRKSLAPAPRAMLDEEVASGAPVQEARVSVSNQGTSVALKVPRRVTIPSDGEPHQIPIGPLTMAAQTEYRAVPKLSADVYLEVSADHPGPWPLLPGPVKAFVGKDYIGTQRLNSEVPVSKRFSLPMGVDRGFSLKRLRLGKQMGTSGLVQKRKYAEYRYEVTIVNHKPAAHVVRIVEPLPQVITADIGVVVEPGPLAPIKDLHPGQMGWRLNLAAGEKKAWTWGYKVEWPVEMKVSGLE